MQELDRCPSILTKGYKTYSPKAIKTLFAGKKVSHILPFSSPSSENRESQEAIKNAGRLSLSGAQTKFGIVIGEDNTLRYSQENEQSTHILKPRPIGYHILNPDYCAANENLTMQLASQVYGIETAANGLCFYQDGHAAYITRRFDVNLNGGKFAQEDFASLMGLSRAKGGSDFKYINGSYEECAEVIHRYVKSSMIDVLKFFRVILFNFISLNDDAHLKNFSLLSDGREYHLSPAYDLINTTLQIYNPRIFALDNGLFKEGMVFSDVRGISGKDFLEFGKRIQLPEKIVRTEIERFSANNEQAKILIESSFLTEDLKKSYLSSYEFRQFMLRL